MSTPGEPEIQSVEQSVEPAAELVDELVVEALGVPIGIPADHVLAARLRRQWSRSLSDRTSRQTVDLTGMDFEDEEALDYAITSLVTVAALAETVGQRLNIHAGAVADHSGRALAVIGPSGAGKTTAVTHLARRLGYLSDETVSLGDDLTIHPHPKPLSVVRDRAAPRVKISLSPDELGLVEPPPSTRLHRLVLLHRGEGEVGLALLDTAHAIIEIVAQTSSLVHLDHPIARLADTIEACGGAWALHYDEIERWVDELVALLDRPAVAPSPRAHLPYDSATVADVPAGSWSRTTWHDAVQFDDEIVVMAGDTAHLLAGLGVVLWLALATPQSRDGLIRHTQDVLGEHPDAASLVTLALDELAEKGLLAGPV